MDFHLHIIHFLLLIFFYLSLGLLSACCIPTRIVSSTAMIIGNMFLNTEFDWCNVIVNDTSDHIMLLMEIHPCRQVATAIKTIRRLDATSVLRLNELLFKIDPSPCLDYENTKQASQYLVNEFVKALILACHMSSAPLRRYIRPKKP